MKRFITTPIYYVNGSPHIGHAYTTVAADVLARYYRIVGDEVHFLTGSDEHGAKIAKSAKEKDISAQALADSISKEFKNSWSDLDISYDQFIRTTDKKHEEVVQKMLQKIYDAGYIYEGEYEGLYCVGCEEYKKEVDLENGNCPIHQKPVEALKENIWFFKLSAFEEKIKNLFQRSELEIFPESRKNEILSFLGNGLEDIALSRSQVEWGIQVPWDKTQTIYVWVDALINYYSATIIDEKAVFPPSIQVIGKDILRFHAVIWPALLLAAGLDVPKQLAVHGFFTINGHKMSKSLGNVISPKELIDVFGVDGTRYLLLSQFSFGQDGDFSLEKLKQKYNSSLANSLGNLLQRAIVLAKKLEVTFEKPEVNALLDYKKDFKDFQFAKIIEKMDALSAEMNVLIDKEMPWKLDPKSPEAKDVMDKIGANILTIADVLAPFMPEISLKIKHQIASLEPKPLFPKVEND